MTTTPGDDDIDWSALEDEIGEVVPTFTVTVLDDMALLTKYRELTSELMDRGEALKPRTDTARDLQSERAACLIELRRRGLM